MHRGEGRGKKKQKTDWLNGRLATFPGCFMDADAPSTTTLSKKTTWLAWLWTEIYTNMEPVVPKHGPTSVKLIHPWFEVPSLHRLALDGREERAASISIWGFPYTVYLVNKSLFVDMWVGLTAKNTDAAVCRKTWDCLLQNGEKYWCNSTIENRQ